MRNASTLAKSFLALGLATAFFTLAAQVHAADSDGVPWAKSLEQAMEQAKAENKLIFMDVFAEWCPPCQKMLRETFPDETVIIALKDYVPVKVDSDKEPGIAQQYGVQNLPTLFVLTADGAPIHREIGFLAPEDLLSFLKTAQSRLEELKALEEEVRMEPDNVDSALRLADMYLEFGRAGDAVALLQKTEPKLEGVDAKDSKAQLAFSLGLAHLMDGAYDKGVSVLEGYVQEYPSHAQNERAKELIMRGKVFDALTRVDKGEYEQARTVLTQLTKTSTNPQITAFAEDMLAQLEVLGRPAPAWQVDWLGEKSASVEKQKGKVTALAFVEPKAGENAQVAAQLQNLQEEYGAKGLETVIIVSSPTNGMQQPDTAAVSNWVSDAGLTCPVGIDQNGVTTYALYKGEQTPWVALIGTDGTVHYLGEFDEGEIDSKLTGLLASEA